MANDLIIGGSTYKNIDYIRVMRSDGTVATYYDSDRLDNRVMRASLTAVAGTSFSLRAPGLQTGSPEVVDPDATAGGAYSTEAQVQLDNPETSIEIQEGEPE